MFKDRENIINAILGLLLATFIIGIIIQVKVYNAAERFKWRAAVTSTKGYTIQVAYSDFFHTGDSGSETDKSKILNEGYEDKNFTQSGKDNSFYPDSLKICWYSYDEQKFYEGNFALPYKQILTQANTLRTTTKEYNLDYPRPAPETVDLQFVAEIAPQGKITAWITDGGQRLKIGGYKATRVSQSWDIFREYNPGADYYRNNTAAHTALVMEKHAYKIEVILPEEMSVKTIDLTTFNQKNWKLEKGDDPTSAPFNYIPSDLELTWGTEGMTFSTQFAFRDSDVLAAFRKLQPQAGSAPVILQIKVNDKNDIVSLKLKNAKEEVLLKSDYPMEVRSRN